MTICLGFFEVKVYQVGESCMMCAGIKLKNMSVTDTFLVSM